MEPAHGPLNITANVMKKSPTIAVGNSSFGWPTRCLAKRMGPCAGHANPQNLPHALSRGRLESEKPKRVWDRARRGQSITPLRAPERAVSITGPAQVSEQETADLRRGVMLSAGPRLRNWRTENPEDFLFLVLSLGDTLPAGCCAGRACAGGLLGFPADETKAGSRSMKTTHKTRKQRGEVTVAMLVAMVIVHVLMAGVTLTPDPEGNPIPGPSCKL